MKEVAKPYRNQRVTRRGRQSQQHLLEVSIRASKAREQRLRKAAGIVFKLIVLAGLLAGTWIGMREAAQHFFWENPRLFLTDVRVETDGTLTREQILTVAGVQEGRNIFSTDLAKARAALDSLPQIQRVEVQRTLPNRFDIRIVERQPIAWLAAAGDVDPSASERSFLMDARGYVMKPRKLLPEYLHLPIITGVETENLVAGQKVATLEMQAALDLLRLNSNTTRWQARNIDIRKGYCLVVTDRNNAEITFGLDHIDSQLARLFRILDYVQPTHQEIRTVNLFVERNTPVTFFEKEEPQVAVDEGPAEVQAKLESPSKEAVEVPKAKPASKEVDKPAPVLAKKQPVVKKAVATSKPATRVKKASTPAKKSSVESLKRPFRM